MVVDTRIIESLLQGPQPSAGKVARILEKAGACKGLGIEDSAALITIEAPDILNAVFKKAGEVKERVFGKRVVLFAPLYLSNHCTNGCVYCGFRSANREFPRKALDVPQTIKEARSLEEMGFKRVLLVTGEDPRYGLDYIISCVRAIYENTGIRIVHVNAPPMDTESLKALKGSGAGVYQAFQETYHRPTYEKMHPWGMKKDYDFRIEVMDRAMSAGFGDVGIGPLLGLYDYRFDSLSAIAHSRHLYDEFGAHAHTISIPRLRPAQAGLSEVPCPVSDEELKKIVAVLRLSVPSAGVVVSTREGASLRNRLMHVGATQLSAASRTNPGGYTEGEGLEQFSTNDKRSLPEVIRSVIDEGYLPSLCTTCYRVGRVGHEFTEKTIAGEMGRLCQANAILTLKEYLLDHIKNGSREAVERSLEEGLKEVKDQALKDALIRKLKELEEGGRDLFF
ncbi:MAG: [FeFe] hydrogenase H-cluster radical SAM maturase HydG [Deltaproteobacteria bacterium]|nr:[FeFe] hydrogenase H-cluster radical SAM maturase HydG [Deltaproteobacteria bacterium]